MASTRVWPRRPGAVPLDAPRRETCWSASARRGRGRGRARRGARPYRTKQIGGDAGFVQKHEVGDPRSARRRRPRGAVSPVTAPRRETCWSASARRARQTVGTLAGVARASFSSASVRSGCAAISAAKVCRCGSSMQRRPCRWTRGATSPVSRRRCFSSRTHDPLTRYFAATSAAFIPASLSRSTRSRRSIE